MQRQAGVNAHGIVYVENGFLRHATLNTASSMSFWLFQRHAPDLDPVRAEETVLPVHRPRPVFRGHAPRPSNSLHLHQVGCSIVVFSV